MLLNKPVTNEVHIRCPGNATSEKRLSKHVRIYHFPINVPHDFSPPPPKGNRVNLIYNNNGNFLPNNAYCYLFRVSELHGLSLVATVDTAIATRKHTYSLQICFCGLPMINKHTNNAECQVFMAVTMKNCHLLGYKNPVRISQETNYVSAREHSRLMLCKI
jgi:hypothetical protein